MFFFFCIKFVLHPPKRFTWLNRHKYLIQLTLNTRPNLLSSSPDNNNVRDNNKQVLSETGFGLPLLISVKLFESVNHRTTLDIFIIDFICS